MGDDCSFWQTRFSEFGWAAVNAGSSESIGRWDNWLRQVALRRLGFVPRGKILDVGTGTGYWAEKFARTGAFVTGIDFCRPPLKVAQTRCQSLGEKIAWVCGDVAELPFKAGSFDAVVSVMCLQHITSHERQQRAVQALVDCLKPGGHMVLIEGVHPRSNRRYIRTRPFNSWVEVCSSAGAKLVRACVVDVLKYRRWVPHGITAIVNSVLSRVVLFRPWARSMAMLFVRPKGGETLTMLVE